MKRLCFIVMILLAAPCANAGETIALDEALKRTVEKNPQIQKAKADLEEASGRRLVFHAVGLPDATIGIVGGDQGGHRAGQDGDQPFGFAYGSARQALFNASVPASRRRGDVGVVIAQQQLNVAVVEQLHAARIAFYTALYNRSLTAARQEEGGRLEQNASSQKSRYESGLADRSLVVSAEVQTRELEPRIASAQRGYEGALLKLAEAMGEDLGPKATPPRPEGSLQYREVEIDVDRAVDNALEQRPDLKLGRLLVHAANEDQRIIAAQYYPAINAVISGEYIPVSGVRQQQGQGSPRRSDDIISSEVRAGGAYTWRVIDNGKVYGAVAKQRAVREVNELMLRKIETGVSRDLSRIKNDLEAIAIEQKALVMAASAAEQNAATVRQNLEGGVVSQLEFRLAENALLDARTGLLSLAYKQNVALAEWDRATGKYLQFLDDSAENVQ